MAGFDTIRSLLKRIYGPEKGKTAFERILPLIRRAACQAVTTSEYFSQNDTVLITYGDSIKHDGEPPLKTFQRFARQYFKGVFSTIHFLPFFPYSSDDGFSVTDFFAVDPNLGRWDDVAKIGSDFDLMFDMVLNHISAKSHWFGRYLKGTAGFMDLALEMDPETDLSGVTRPRALPLLTPFEKKSGRPVHLWTTFSPDQIDLNYRSLDVLEKMVSVLLFYVENGARILRFDAIAYLWKEIGTSCIHLPQTHDMVRLFRSILDIVAPSVLIITETNVPHEENISYFGNGRDEAQLVYNFTLPPLLLHAFLSQDARHLSRWAQTLQLPSKQTTFFNFTASHDGIGVRPLEGILPDEEIMRLVQLAKNHGAGAAMKQNPDGSESPYELNITYLDALLCQPTQRKVRPVDKFLASQAIQYALPGVPATYIHSILGSRNWHAGVRQTSRARTINREKCREATVVENVKDPGSFRYGIFHDYLKLIKIRKRQPAFHPTARMAVLDLNPSVFAIWRSCPDQQIGALTNVSEAPVTVSLSGRGLPSRLSDLLTGRAYDTDSIQLDAHQYLWLTPQPLDAG
ncbi:MAG: sugar phosphorylase [Deltaproteobacteria bacterium]|nr:sugar phosphorylase [Deltaproteobacteria bacterium]